MILSMRPEMIIIHHSLTEDGKVVDVQAIRRYHMSYAYNGFVISHEKALVLMAEGKTVKKPWSDIGYHFIVERINNSYEVLMGRMPDRRGAHCKGENSRSIGICFTGNFDDDPPPPEQWALGVRLCKWIVLNFSLFPSSIHGHREFNTNKTCPGKEFNLHRFRYEVGKE